MQLRDGERAVCSDPAPSEEMRVDSAGEGAGDASQAARSTNVSDASDTSDAASELTAEERAAIQRRNALIRAFDAALTDVRQRSYEGKLTSTDRWRKRSVAPEGMTAQAFEAELLDYLNTHDHAEAKPVTGRLAAPKPLDVQLQGQDLGADDPLPELDVTDIALMQGKKATYLYSAALLSHSFAKALYHTVEDNDIATFVDVVRTESSTYPRPVGIGSFMNPPYLWSRSHTREVFASVQAAGSFRDLHDIKASNGATYYYSDLYLSEAQARSLAEWAAVERQRNP